MASQNLLFDEPKALSAWLQERRSKTDYLFPSRFDDGHLKIKSASQAAAKVMIDAGIPTELAHHHSLKHALASLPVIRSKVDLSFVKQDSGHASISSTIHYVHIADSRGDGESVSGDSGGFVVVTSLKCSPGASPRFAKSLFGFWLRRIRSAANSCGNFPWRDVTESAATVRVSRH